MIIMALDHLRDYFHDEAWFFSPTDLTRTNAPLFFTRWITHFCAPVFVFLAGISACLYGAKRGRQALVFFLWTRGLWLVFVDLFIVGLFRTFNLSFPFFNLQVLWAIGIGMIVLSALAGLSRNLLLLIGVVLVAGHNLLDAVYLPVLHNTVDFVSGHFTLTVHYPVLPWIGILIFGYYTGYYYLPEFDPETRKPKLILMGYGAIAIFIVFRAINWYGDPSHWARQGSGMFTLLSFLNVTKYPPSLLYTLMTLGPALIFLAFFERRGDRWGTGRQGDRWGTKRRDRWGARVAVFGRTAMFFYLAHILLIHLLAVVAAVVTGYKASDMVLSGRINAQASLKGYGFPLIVVYLIWFGLLLLLYPLCKWFDRYKRTHQASKWWLSYL
jgi:uncharacterized membrane protein